MEVAGDVAGPFAAKLLADAGAETIKVEPLGGDPSRRMAPFAEPAPHRDTSTVFLSYNTSKRSVSLDMGQAAGRRMLQALLVEADVLVTDFGPTALEAAGLNPRQLRNDHPQLIIAAVTPYGLDGAGGRVAVVAADSRPCLWGGGGGCGAIWARTADRRWRPGARVHEADAGDGIGAGGLGAR